MSLPVDRVTTTSSTTAAVLEQQRLKLQQQSASRNAERGTAGRLPATPVGQAGPGNVSRFQGEAARLGVHTGPDVQEAADRVMKTGVRWLIKNDHEARMDVFGEELQKGDPSYQGRLAAEIVRRDPGAFKSWLQPGRMDALVDEGRMAPAGRRAMLDALGTALQDGLVRGDQVPTGFVRDCRDPALTGAYMGTLNLDDQDDFGRALDAFSGLGPDGLRSFVADPGQRTMVLDLTLAVQQHQDWYESLSTGAPWGRPGGVAWEREAPLQFSKAQLTALRQAFQGDNGLMTRGELLLAYPDRLERNGQVTRQYHELSEQMGGIVGTDNANWATLAQWASEEIGRNLDGTRGIAAGEPVLGDPGYWLSAGNARLIFDIGPAFRYFVDTFDDPTNHGMGFEPFWKGFEEKWGGRGLSYVDGRNDPKPDMKNAFKAYHEAMQLKDKEAVTTDPAQRAALAGRRGQLMLYGNLRVCLQELKLIQPEPENGLKSTPIQEQPMTRIPFACHAGAASC